MTSKCLIIGDTHYDTKCEGYLENQIDSTIRIVREHKPTHLIFLGDIYHHRKPSPEVVVAVQKMFFMIRLLVEHVYILRGNHDSANKSDDGLTCLETLTYPGSNVTLIQHTFLDTKENMLFIPHYEKEEIIQGSLSLAPNSETLVFGHFGFAGCLNGAGFHDSSLEPKEFKNTTILGHIHRYEKEDNVTVLGTPWSTNYGECDYDHVVGVLEKKKGKWGSLTTHKVTIGPRYYVCPMESLEVMKDEIKDPNYFTLLRVLIDKFSDDSIHRLKSDILEKFSVASVDLKFQPVYDTKLNNRLSNYDPNVPISDIDNDVIEKYIEEQASSIPKELLQEGLDLIKTYEDTED